MAQRQILILQDDIDGSEDGVKRVIFGFDGKWFQIDLGPNNYAAMEEALAPYVAAAAPYKGQRKGKIPVEGMTPAQRREQNEAARSWAKDLGLPVAERGRVPASVIKQWNAAGRPRTSRTKRAGIGPREDLVQLGAKRTGTPGAKAAAKKAHKDEHAAA